MMPLGDHCAALRAGVRLVFPEDPGTEVRGPGAGALPAGTALQSRGHPRGALMRDRNRLVRKGLPVGFLAKTAALAGPVPAKGPIREDRLAGAEVLIAAAAGAGQLVGGFPVALPVGGGVGGTHGFRLIRNLAV